MNTKISTSSPSLFPAALRRLADALARWTRRIDSSPMPTHHRMGAWERSVRQPPRERRPQ